MALPIFVCNFTSCFNFAFKTLNIFATRKRHYIASFYGAPIKKETANLQSPNKISVSH